MSLGVGRRVAVHPNAIGPNGTHPKLVLMSDGVIFPRDGAGLPKISPADPVQTGVTDWNTPRFTPTYNTTAGRPNSDIGNYIVVTDWTDLTDIKGHVLDGWGNIHPFGSDTLKLNATGVWPNADVAKALVVNAAGDGGFVLDYSGGMHRCGTQATTIGNGPSFPATDIARDVVCDFTAPSGPHGFILDGYGGMHKFASPVGLGDAWMDNNANPVYGGTYHPGWDIMRAIVYNFTTNLGAVLDGFGAVLGMGVGAGAVQYAAANIPIPGYPYWNGTDTARDLANPASRFYVTLDTTGVAHEWNQFVVPILSITSPPTSLTNTSRPTISFVYGFGQAAPNDPAPMTDVGIWIYPLAVTTQTGFKEDQGFGAVFSHYLPGITGINQGSTYSVTMADDLLDSTQYKLYVTATSTDGISSGWVSRAFTTAFNRPAAPSLSGANQKDNATGARNSLTASGSGTFQFQFTDDPTETLWYDVAGASQATSATVFDYDAIFQRDRKYRVYRVNVSPYLRSNSSNELILNFALPTAGGSWSLSTISASPTVVNIRAAAWTKVMHQQNEVHYPASAIKGVVLSGGVKGITGTLEIWLTDPTNPTAFADRTKHDDFVELLTTAQPLKLQNPGGEQWYVWADDVSFELLKTPLGRFVYKATAQFTEVERPLVVA